MGILALSLALAFTLFSTSLAQTLESPVYESSGYDLINAVNSLRAAYGLPAYGISPILMFTAQNQSDFMAATGQVTHSGPGGSTFTERLLGAGYPLAGDLTLGGFRSENIIAGEVSMTAQDAVDAWMGDAPHQNTMLSQNLTEIGAGVTVANGRVYYVIDCARPTTAGAPPAGTQAQGTGAGVPGSDVGVVIPVTVSTPNVNGEVVHEVQSGQSLWAIAIAYGVKINDIMRLNNLTGNDIYPGEKLLIKYHATLTPAPPTATLNAQTTPTMTLRFATDTLTLTTAPEKSVSSAYRVSGTAVVIAVIVLAALGAGLFARFGSFGMGER